MTEYRLRQPSPPPADAPATPGGKTRSHANDHNHPRWFCAELSQILRPYPDAYHRVCDWLAELEARGHIPAD